MANLIPEHAKKTLEEQDAARAERARSGPQTGNQFRHSFIRSYAQEIEMLRLGAVVTETVAEAKRRLQLPVEPGDETRVYSAELPSGKPIPTQAQAARAIWWARFTRSIRNFFRKVWSWIRD